MVSNVKNLILTKQTGPFIPLLINDSLICKEFVFHFGTVGFSGVIDVFLSVYA